MSDRPVIAVVLGSTRDGRIGESVAKWFMSIASQRQDLQVELVDLKEWNLPMFNEPNNPSTGIYTHEHTKRWSAAIAKYDGYVFVTSEYNHGYPAALKNALDYLYHEWGLKPAAFVSYGGPAGGARVIEQLKLVALDLHLVPVHRSIMIPFVKKALADPNGLPEFQRTTATVLLDQLVWWANVLRSARQNNSFPVPPKPSTK